MPFIRMDGLPGKVYVPRTGGAPPKHRCPDCYRCQHCSDDRCQVCVESAASGRGTNTCEGKKARGKYRATGCGGCDSA